MVEPRDCRISLTGDLFQFSAAVDPRGVLPCVRNPYTGVLTQTAGCSINLPAVAPVFARSNRFRDWAVYAQDSFRVTPKFTLNYGVRYEYFGVQHNNKKNLDSNFYYGTGTNPFQNIRNGQVYTSPTSPIDSLWNPQYGTVSPPDWLRSGHLRNGEDRVPGRLRHQL